jgi:DNA-binding NarL/FixJ family response regulator
MSKARACPPVQAKPLINHEVPHPLGAAMFSDHAWGEIARSLRLSGRELQIVRGVFGDRVESAIATDLGISSHTVHTHLCRLHRKLEVATRTQLILRVMEKFMALTSSQENNVVPLPGRRTAGNRPPRS